MLERRAAKMKEKIEGLAGSGADIRGKVRTLNTRASDDEAYAETLFKELRGTAQKTVASVQDTVILPAFQFLKHAQRK